MNHRFSVSHFSTYIRGGAATAAIRIHRGLQANGFDSRFLHRGDDVIDDPSFSVFEPKKLPENPILRGIVKNYRRQKARRARYDYRMHLDERPKEFECFSTAHLYSPSNFDFRSLNTDIIQLHWVSFLLDYRTFFSSISKKTPIVWTLHDMNAFTGGCHYSGKCDKFKTGCGSCEQLANPKKTDSSFSSFLQKQKSLSRRNLHIVTPSRWLGEVAKQSPVLPKQTTYNVIRYGLDTQAFDVIPTVEAKAQLGIDPWTKVIAFGAEDLANRRKGFAPLWRALERLSDQLEGQETKVTCLVFGSGELPKAKLRNVKIQKTGYLNTTEEKCVVYSAADCFVMPSLQDNQPQTGLEAMSCGTPVVAFSTGGIPEYVIEGVTGMLAPVGNDKILSEKLMRMIDSNETSQRLGRSARSMIVQEFDLKNQAAEYIKLYEQITGKQHQESKRRVAA